MADSPVVDFCIVNYKSTKDVGRVILQLSMTYPGPHTVTVVDNSTNNRGFSKATNLAASRETGDIICFLNPDLSLCENWADETLREMQADPQLVIAGPRLDDGIPWPRNLKYLGLQNWVCGAAFFVRRDFFESCGGFDERYFFSCEESDLCRQAEEKGLRVQTVGEPRVKHIRHGTAFHEDELAKAAKLYREKWKMV